jgi:hypothetical protein
VGAACDEDHVVAVLEHPPADDPADGARAIDDEAHRRSGDGGELAPTQVVGNFAGDVDQPSRQR